MINAWYLDDGTLCGSANDLCAALRIIEEDGPARGLHLNRLSLSFTSLSAPLLFPTPFQLISLSPKEGSTSWVPPLVPQLIVKQLSEKSGGDLQDAQMEFVLLHSCLALPKVAFALRSCPPSKIRGATAAFDRAMREVVVGAPLSGCGPLPGPRPPSTGLGVPPLPPVLAGTSDGGGGDPMFCLSDGRRPPWGPSGWLRG